MSNIFLKEISARYLFMISATCFGLFFLNRMFYVVNDLVGYGVFSLGIATFLLFLGAIFIRRSETDETNFSQEALRPYMIALFNTRQKIGLMFVLIAFPILPLIMGGWEEFIFFVGFGGFLIVIPLVVAGLLLLFIGSFLKLKEVRSSLEAPKKVTFFSLVLLILSAAFFGLFLCFGGFFE